VPEMKEWVFWIVQLAIGLLIAGNFFWLKRYIEKNDEWRRGVDENFQQDGGVVHRGQYFDWCKENRAGCPVHDICSWRSAVIEEGGVLTRDRHDEICEKNTLRVLSKIDECFHSYRELVAGQLALMASTFETKILKEIKLLKSEIERK
jgi:hypothetical protein